MSTFYSLNEYTGDGSTTQYAVNFTLDYINKSDVAVFVDGTPQAFTWISDGLIQLTTAPSNGAFILIKRNTDLTSLINDYQNGSVIIEQNLDDSFKQTVLSAQEALDSASQSIAVDAVDGKWQASDRIIKNVKDGVDTQDAVNVGQLTTHDATIIGYKDAAEASAIAASTSEANALSSASTATTQAGIATTKASESLASEVNAANSATASANSATASANSATQSANSASASATSATASEGSATNASTSASNAATSETNAANSATSSTNSATASANSATASANSATASATSATEAQASLNEFQGQYHGASATAPTTGLDAGDLYFDTALGEMRVYDGTDWKAAGSTVNGTAIRQSYTATASQTTFTVTGGYDATFADVYLNGVKLVNGVDVNVTSGTNVVLTTGATAGDSVDVIAYGAFEVANTYTQAQVDALLGALDALPSQTGHADQYLKSDGTNADWADVGAINGVFYENDQTVTANYTITTGKNAGSFGSITVADGVTVTVPDGSNWSIV